MSPGTRVYAGAVPDLVRPGHSASDWGHGCFLEGMAGPPHPGPVPAVNVRAVCAFAHSPRAPARRHMYMDGRGMERGALPWQASAAPRVTGQPVPLRHVPQRTPLPIPPASHAYATQQQAAARLALPAHLEAAGVPGVRTERHEAGTARHPSALRAGTRGQARARPARVGHRTAPSWHGQAPRQTMTTHGTTPICLIPATHPHRAWRHTQQRSSTTIRRPATTPRRPPHPTPVPQGRLTWCRVS